MTDPDQVYERIQQSIPLNELSRDVIESFLMSGFINRQTKHSGIVDLTNRHTITEWKDEGGGDKREKVVPGITFSHKFKKLLDNLNDLKNEDVEKALIEVTNPKISLIKKGKPVKTEDLENYSTASSNLVEEYKDKLKVERENYLKKKGRVTTIFRNNLKSATSGEEIETILSNAREELGEGRNYESLKEAGDIMKEILKSKEV